MNRSVWAIVTALWSLGGVSALAAPRPIDRMVNCDILVVGGWPGRGGHYL